MNNPWKRVAIVQSNYIPWKGYFDMIHLSDEFIFLDDVQYTRRDWRNRNLIKTPQGLYWLTIPVVVKGNYLVKIRDIKIADAQWPQKHWGILKNNYVKAAHFKECSPIIEELYLNCREEYLSEINYRFITAICKILKIETKISRSSDYDLTEGKTERLLALCEAAGAKVYLSGPAAKDYLDEELFHQKNIEVEWMDYSAYPAYRQLFPPFEHGVSILDLLFNEGEKATEFMKSFARVK